ncbi:hypothetical protein TW95_gp0387 [Pandoravirus inopinatum]|uniref:Uncharacterized protein n=1 Tax=Pandoravirus inopinatum TaxID=1605721 RepID=A0A0B5J8K7_9VIRU|nr:hypothetical protein TW95_gp0387 [Pandoravirus inopinatum]AJF97121.1 hypothetical protein [Pandoravirus inopinatum]
MAPMSGQHLVDATDTVVSSYACGSKSDDSCLANDQPTATWLTPAGIEPAHSLSQRDYIENGMLSMPNPKLSDKPCCLDPKPECNRESIAPTVAFGFGFAPANTAR